MGVLTVRDNEHNVIGSVGGDEVKLPIWEMHRKIPGGTDPVSRPYFSGEGDEGDDAALM
jgi:hypothetical protein